MLVDVSCLIPEFKLLYDFWGCQNPGSEWVKFSIHFYEGKQFLTFIIHCYSV